MPAYGGSGAVAPYSWTPEESKIESCEHQNNANVRCQPFPESVSKEREIHTDYDNYHCHYEKRDSELSAYSSLHGRYCKGANEFPESSSVSFAAVAALRAVCPAAAGSRPRARP